MENYTVIECPHCKNSIQIFHNEINCAIFRHGIIKTTGQQLNPHAPKNICDNLFENNLIYGCGKPFKISKKQTEMIAEICDYI
jgi:hypothetical protein